jgi:prepilin-type N-terminal cleavage/methylation domain-containing protein
MPPVIMTRPCQGFTLLEVLIATAVIGIITGIGVVAVTGTSEAAREARIQNDVIVLNNGIDAYRAAGGVIPSGASAAQAIAKLKTVADPSSSTAFGPSGPFIDPRLQISMQSASEGSQPDSRADYPNASGYFYVRKGGAAGIKEFVQGAASAVVTETRQGSMPATPGGGFLTAYTDQSAGIQASAAAPPAIAGADDPAKTGKDLVKLPRPVLELRYGGSASFMAYNGESLPLTALEDPVTKSILIDARVSSPFTAPEAQLRLVWDGAAMTAVANPNIRSNIDVRTYTNSKTFVKARVFSLDTNRYTDSDPLQIAISTIPGQVEPVFPVSTEIPATLTYVQAGGPMYVSGVLTSNARPPVTVSLSNIEKVPAMFLSLLSGYLKASYTRRYTGLVDTATNTDFSPSGGFKAGTVPINVAGFGTATSINISATVQSANSNILVSGQALDKVVSIQPTALGVNVLPLKPIGLPPSVTITYTGDYPAGVRLFYTLTTGNSGAAPLNPTNGGTNIASSILYSSPITNYPIATYTVVAQATGPLGTEHWFTCTPKNNTYIAITTVPLSYIGLNMYRANINGYVQGSIYMQAGDFAVLNAGSTISGNVYLPGLPSVTLPASGGTVVAKGKSYTQSSDANISTNRITGREYTTEGTLADPQTDLRKIVDVYGSTTPANYDFRVNSSARIDGKVYRRADPPPVSSQKPQLPSGIALSNAPVTVSGTTTLGVGSYAVTMNNTNSVLRLGSPGNITSYIFGVGSVWAAGRVEILGPVQIYLNAATSFNGVTFGSSNTIYQTGFVVMSNYSVTIDNGGSVYGQFEARDSALSIGSGGGQTIRGSLFGSAFANTINVDGSGYVDVSGGSGTNSSASTNTP